MLLRIDDTDAARNVEGGEEAILATSSGSASTGTTGRCARASGRSATARRRDSSADRFDGVTLLREDGTADVPPRERRRRRRLRDHARHPRERPPAERSAAPAAPEALGATPPEYVHHGLILGEDGKKLSKRAEGATVASLREAGIPAEAVRAYLEELGLPAHDVHYDLPRIRRLAIDAIGALRTRS